MQRLFLAILCVLQTQISFCLAEDWPRWRGPNGDNHAAEGTQIPLRWNLDTGENIRWKTKIPGRGHSTPIVIADSIFLTSADNARQLQAVLKFDRVSGRKVDQWVLHRGTLPARIHPNNSHASPSPAFDGENLYVAFHTDDAIWVTAMTPGGRIVWKKRVSEFRPSAFQFGYGASPLIEGDLVIVAAEYDGADSGLYALDSRNGRQIWQVRRPVNLNFASPIAATIAGRRQVLIAGAETVTSYDPETGQQLWQVDASTEAICSTIAWDGRRVITSGGNPESGTWCVSGDGTQRLIWNNGVKCYEQSLLTIDGYVFAVADSGVAYCWRTSDGIEMWKQRLCGGGISASPLLVNDRMIVASEDAMVYVLSASPDRFDLLAKNPSGDSIYASPIAVNNRLYLRTAVGSGDGRQEYLVAIGSE